MLVLARRVGEEIVVGQEEVVVKVIAIRPNAVCLGFQLKNGLTLQSEIKKGEKFYAMEVANGA